MTIISLNILFDRGFKDEIIDIACSIGVFACFPAFRWDNLELDDIIESTLTIP